MGGGGGATHIATQSGVLSSLSSTTNSILVVAGGGGGTYDGSSSPSAYGHGGGYVGQTGNARSTGYVSYGGTQTSGGRCSNASGGTGEFGQGGRGGSSVGPGGGGGWYGGAGGYRRSYVDATYYSWSAGGGSGYFATGVVNGCMYSYNTTFTSTDAATKTVSTTNVSETPTSEYAKQGNGYARITLVE